MEKAGFITPPGHKNFLAKKLFDEMGAIQWGALAYIEKGSRATVRGHDTGKTSTRSAR